MLHVPFEGDFIPVSSLLINVNRRSQERVYVDVCFNIAGSLYLMFPLPFSSPFIHIWKTLHDSGSSPMLTLPLYFLRSCHTEAARLPVAVTLCHNSFSCLSTTTSFEGKT